MKLLTELPLAGQRVLIRQDLNVPLENGEVSSDKRIRASLPTIKLAVQSGAKVLVMSHLGRPTEGEPSTEASLACWKTFVLTWVKRKTTKVWPNNTRPCAISM